jgi:hypothetical protein
VIQVEARRFDQWGNSGIIHKVAGTGSAGFSGDGGLDTLAQLNGPSGIAIDNIGNIYIADQQNNRIRKIDTTHIVSAPQILVSDNGVVVVPNPNNGDFKIDGYVSSLFGENILIEIVNVVGSPIYRKNIIAEDGVVNEQINLAHSMPPGIYLLHVRNEKMKKSFTICVK